MGYQQNLIEQAVRLMQRGLPIVASGGDDLQEVHHEAQGLSDQIFLDGRVCEDNDILRALVAFREASEWAIGVERTKGAVDASDVEWRRHAQAQRDQYREFAARVLADAGRRVP